VKRIRKRGYREPYVRFSEINPELSVEEMLRATNTDYVVGIAYLHAAFPMGQILTDKHGNLLSRHVHKSDTKSLRQIEELHQERTKLPEHIPVQDFSKVCTVYTDRDSDRWIIAEVGARYTVVQNARVLAEAVAVGRHLGLSVSHLGRNGNGARFAGRFEARGFTISTSLGHRETFTQHLYFSSGHDGNFKYAYSFLMTDPENRVIEYGCIDRKHTQGITDDVAMKKFLERLSRETAEVLDDVKRLANIILSSESLDNGIECLLLETTERAKLRRDFEQHVSRYGRTGWALYEAWLSNFAELGNNRYDLAEDMNSGDSLKSQTKYARANQLRTKRKRLLSRLEQPG
jgi:hypothetical protein